MEVNAWTIQVYEPEDGSYTDHYTFPMMDMLPIDKNNNLFKGCLGLLQAKAMMHDLRKFYLDYGHTIKQFNHQYRLKQTYNNLVDQAYEKGFSYSYSHTLIPKEKV